MTVRFIDPSSFDELQVVEEGDDVVQDGEGYECVMACRSSAEEQVELAEESSERWNACQAEHRNRKCDAEARVLLRKSAKRLECFFAVMPDDAEYEEGEVVRNGIDEEVERDSCQEGDERGYLVLNRGERTIDEHDEEGDCSCFRSYGEHCGNWRRGAFIDIGGPSVEREKRELETDSAEQEQHGYPQERVRTVCDSGLDFVEVEAPCKTVEVAEAEQFKSRRDRTHQNVLGGSFGTELVAFVPSGECVHRDGRNFEPEEEREQVAGTHDCEAAERRERDCSDEFGDLVHLRLAVSAVFKVILRKPHAEQSAHHEHFTHEHAEVIDFPVADEELSDSIVERNQIQEDEDGDKADVRHAPRNLGLRCHEKAYPDYDEREYQQQNVR